MKREDLEQFIKTLNIEEFASFVINNGIVATAQQYGLSHNNVREIKKIFKIKVPEEIRQQRIRHTKKEKYGSATYNNIQKVKERCALKTDYDDLFDLYITQNKSMLEIADLLNTHRKKVSAKLREYNIQKTAQRRYEARELKTQRTNTARYGVSHPSVLLEYKLKAQQTCLERYGVKSFSQSAKYLDLFNNRAYVENYINKANATKRKNNTFNTSKQEEHYYSTLCKRYSVSDVLRNYIDPRYPYKCDFYIKSEDLFIELNAHWTHGGKPYDPKDKECQEQLGKWKEKAKTSKFYENAIKTWTERDVKKLQIAKENNLNYKVIY